MDSRNVAKGCLVMAITAFAALMACIAAGIFMGPGYGFVLAAVLAVLAAVWLAA